MAAITSKDKEEGLQLKQGESKVFSKLFTRESSAAAPSFRVYYGVASAGSVPFLWESQPGTPKNDAIFSTATLQPPLTPPPSYYTAARQKQEQAAPAPHSLSHRHRRNRSSSSSSSSSTATAATGKNNKKLMSTKHYISIFSAMLPKMILHRRWSSARSAPSSAASPSSCSSSSWSSSAFSSSASSSLSLSSFRSTQSPATCSSMRSRVFAFSAADDDDGHEAAAPMMCFSVRHESFRAFRGGRVAMTVKSALASVGGHGHAAGPSPTAAQKV
ncbi:vitellogenin [Sorghum bicolor]|uniref:Uncharacterized protein n=1 Tax=Sorghum bicolor TaxID=4558 RepID=C5XNI7_SORBI|nr:vitellogenin [Sorghum bicolor]EES00247.1 hypothetical protein SORBI_3003G055800 [Sorghum bicolor]|eukprot:XP_002455127.1 vitellogenin [Sorghum bicolor]